ncbi:MAG: helix-turn-helix domain-containing protein [Candidatus Eiseniibacteriota bacterium]
MRRVRARLPAAAAALWAVLPAAALAAFERPALSPESDAAGGLVALSEDPVFGNPAAVRSGLDLRASGGRPFGLPELTEMQAGAARAGSSAAVGAGVRRFGSESYTEAEARVTGAWTVQGALSVGAALRAMSVHGPAFAARRSAALDLAFVAPLEAGTTLAGVVEAVAGEVPGDPGGDFRRTSLGVSRDLAGRLGLRLELQRREDRPLGGALGLCWTPTLPIEIRVGLREDPSTVSWGFTARMGGVAVAASSSHADPLGRTVRVGIALRSEGRPPQAAKRSQGIFKARPRIPDSEESGGTVMQEPWLDAEETAASLQITKATLYKLVRDGRVPADKVSGRWRFTRDAIEALFAAVEEPQEGEPHR